MTQINKDSSETALNMYELLSEQRVGVLGTVDEHGQPHMSVVYFYVDEEFNISFATKMGTHKEANLQNHDDVRFLVFNESNQMTMTVEGKVVDSEDEDLNHKVMQAIHSATQEMDNFEDAPIEKLKVGEMKFHTIRPSKISMAIFIRPQQGGYTEMFETLELDS